MTKKKQHLPLRELMTSIPTALTKLTPCLLMSPLSIAQYLAADAKTFDLVVFDEASQIPVWDANRATSGKYSGSLLLRIHYSSRAGSCLLRSSTLDARKSQRRRLS
jgi:hypothetical protein